MGEINKKEIINSLLAKLAKGREEKERGNVGYIKVHNLNGTSDNDCSCGSWIEHWEKMSGLERDLCSVVGCSNNATEGGHVQKNKSGDKDWYIIPLCKEHNGKHGETLDVIDNPKYLVSANKAKTCDQLKLEKTKKLLEEYKKGIK